MIHFSSESATLQVVNVKGQNDAGKSCLSYVPQRLMDFLSIII